MSTEAVMSQLTPDEDERVCQIEGCSGVAVYHLVKLPEHAAEQERFFCHPHGIEYANRAHLVISENI